MQHSPEPSAAILQSFYSPVSGSVVKMPAMLTPSPSAATDAVSPTTASAPRSLAGLATPQSIASHSVVSPETPTPTQRTLLLAGQEFRKYPWTYDMSAHPELLSNPTACINHKEVTNYAKIDPRLSRLSHNALSHCVMCGRHDVHIPSQNKNVCKACDSAFWLHGAWNVVIKFCKGCKNFFTLDEFADKPEGTKCCKCRQRGRENYLSKKNSSSAAAASPSLSVALSPPLSVSPSVSGERECATQRERERESDNERHHCGSSSESVSSSRSRSAARRARREGEEEREKEREKDSRLIAIALEERDRERERERERQRESDQISALIFASHDIFPRDDDLEHAHTERETQRETHTERCTVAAPLPLSLSDGLRRPPRMPRYTHCNSTSSTTAHSNKVMAMSSFASSSAGERLENHEDNEDDEDEDKENENDCCDDDWWPATPRTRKRARATAFGFAPSSSSSSSSLFVSPATPCAPTMRKREAAAAMSWPASPASLSESRAVPVPIPISVSVSPGERESLLGENPHWQWDPQMNPLMTLAMLTASNTAQGGREERERERGRGNSTRTHTVTTIANPSQFS